VLVSLVYSTSDSWSSMESLDSEIADNVSYYVSGGKLNSTQSLSHYTFLSLDREWLPQNLIGAIAASTFAYASIHCTKEFMDSAYML